jgi:hypothetical protein
MKIQWLHMSDRHIAFYGEPQDCDILARIERMDGGWKWDVVERYGSFSITLNKYLPGLLQSNFAKKLENAMRAAVDWMNNLHTTFEGMGR